MTQPIDSIFWVEYRRPGGVWVHWDRAADLQDAMRRLERADRERGMGDRLRVVEYVGRVIYEPPAAGRGATS